MKIFNAIFYTTVYHSRERKKKESGCSGLKVFCIKKKRYALRISFGERVKNFDIATPVSALQYEGMSRNCKPGRRIMSKCETARNGRNIYEPITVLVHTVVCLSFFLYDSYKFWFYTDGIAKEILGSRHAQTTVKECMRLLYAEFIRVIPRSMF